MAQRRPGRAAPARGSCFARSSPGRNASIIVVRTRRRPVPSTTSVTTPATSSCRTTTAGGASGSCRQFTCKYHAMALRPRRQPRLRPAGVRSSSTSTRDLVRSPSPATYRRASSSSTSTTSPRRRSPRHSIRSARASPAPVRRDDPGVPGQVRRERQLEALHRHAFIEFYHAPILHMKPPRAEEAQKLADYGFEALHYDIFSPHSVVFVVGWHRSPRIRARRQPSGTRCAADCSAVGQARRHQRRQEPAGGRQPGPPRPRAPTRSWSGGHDDPDLRPGWYLTYHYWPPADGACSRPRSIRAPRTPSTASARRWRISTFKDHAFQRRDTPSRPPVDDRDRRCRHVRLDDQEVLAAATPRHRADRSPPADDRPAVRDCATPRRRQRRTPEVVIGASHGCSDLRR